MNEIQLYIYVPRTQMTHILEDLTHNMEGQPSIKEVSWVLGIQYTFASTNYTPQV